LSATVAKWNGYVTAKSDPDLRTTSASPISVAPLYEVRATLSSLELADGTLMTDLQTLKVLGEAGNLIP